MSTNKFKAIRVLVQMFTLLLLITNILLLAVRCFFYRFMSVDEKLSGKSMFYLSLFYVTTGIINMILSFFGACCINSKIKFYMKMFLFCDFIVICFMAVSLLYLGVFYTLSFDQNYAKSIFRTSNIYYYMRAVLDCSDFGENQQGLSCWELVKKTREDSLHIYFILTSLSLFFSVIIFILIKICLRSKIKEPTQVVPRIKECTKVGFSSASLRVRRIIEAPNPNFTAGM